MAEPRLFPIQAHHLPAREGGKVPEPVYMAAYAVYKHVYGEQEAMVDLEGRGCRGGFSTGELVAFLYAATFKQELWRQKVDEAFLGMKL
jgi:hypothetical protein